ncbi:hypothetical protein HJFPF1_04074 [Paramyrothecium foliicola]|nr:hypothetical protein HJFPF1_04074 [Paramyrothecium foliicola]
MIVLLAFFDEKPIFDGEIVTLNTIVSILSTTSKVCLIAAISSCVSQEGWIMFARRPRRLYDLEMVAQASRGPLGSFKLLWSWRVRGAFIVRVGALVTVLAIAIEPFSQQLIQYRQTFTETSGGAVPQAVRYSKGAQYGRFMPAYTVNDQGRVDLPANESYLYVAPDFAMRGAIEFSLTSLQRAVEQQAQFDCPGTDCNFDEFESLAVCSQCVDLNSRLERHNNGTGYQLSDYKWDQSSARMSPNSTVYRLPNGLFLDNIDNDYGVGDNMVYMTTSGTADPERSVAMGHIDTLIWSQSMIRALADPFASTGPKWPNFEMQASECALYYCVKNYSVDVRNGTISQDSTSVQNVKRNPDSWQPTGSNRNEGKISRKLNRSLAYHPADSLISRSDLQLTSGQGKTWNVSKEAVDGISYFMQNLFATCLDRSAKTGNNCTDAAEYWGTTNGFYLTVSLLNGASEEYQPSTSKVLFEAPDYEGVFERLAISMSNALRAGDHNGTLATGRVLHPSTVYTADWRWFALPSFVELAGLLFFALAVWSSARTRESVPVWKSSELAVLSHGIAAHDALKDANTPQEQEKIARDAQVLLRKGTGELLENVNHISYMQIGQKNNSF